MKRVLEWFLNYGLVAAILVWAITVALMAYRLTDSPWRWAFAGLSLVGVATIAGIFWIRRYINSLAKPSDQETKS